MTEKSRKTDFLKSKTTVTHHHVNLPRGRGRPKGSKNKLKESAPALNLVLKRGRGRPKGAKNKVTNIGPLPAPSTVKGRGRPKGAKNKPKATDTEEVLVLHKKRNQDKPATPVKEAATTPESSTTGIPDNHPLLEAVRWLEKYTHPVEMRYYRGRATKYISTGFSVEFLPNDLSLN
jgi:hypothetical protein